MASPVVFVFFFFIVFLCLSASPAWARLPWVDDLKPILVHSPNFHKRYLTGYVYCLGCQPHSSRESTPIEGAKVEVICENAENQVSFYEEAVTDCFGLFHIELKQYQYPTKDHCIAKLLSSPDPTCNVITCFNNGDKGVTISKSNAHEAMGFIDHTIGPFAFTHNYCNQH